MRRLVFILVVLLAFGCNPSSREPAVVKLAKAPAFSADSAFSFIEQQLAFGHRVPTTIGHQLCGDFLVNKFSNYGLSVTEQKDTVFGFDNHSYPLRNIIGSINTENPKRILLCAHWDSRPYTDQAEENRTDSLVGANDNASGVAVLLEIARLLEQSNLKVGVDLVLFDVEDQGRPAYEDQGDPNDHGYMLGSKYWAENLSGLKPKYGVLLDMVGAKEAEFTLEGTSVHYAPEILYKVWDLGNQLGFTDLFKYNLTRPVVDDHSNINEIAKIPCIDIIHYDVTTPTRLGQFWHTHDDDIEIIDKKVLESVGQTLLQLLYNEGAETKNE